ncbi:MAG: ribonuclease J [Caldilineales bacterium]|nr:ribonuclease J [Caldilineales bacterium]MDW8317632.1 ribonuclease J [Anaerolineae bacterium]
MQDSFDTLASSPEQVLRIIPLGGVGEIGKNMMVLEYDGQLLVIDAGLMFPESDMLGVDLIIPDIEYLAQRADRVVGIVLTHGHEDHIGALPYLLPAVDAPVYATRLTRGLAEVKLRQRGLLGQARFHTITADDVLQLGPFTVEFFHVCHSIPDTVGVAVTTPVGLVVHTSDYKFDQHPVDGRLTDYAKLQALGERGVLVLLSDSTNAEVAGFTPSEREIEATFERIFSEAPGRIFVATFASNISRVMQVLRLARRFGRRLGLVGRSMRDNVRMAASLGYLDLAPGELLSVEEIETLPDREVVVVCTGSQGEPTSALVRMSLEDHRINIRPGDTVILSAQPIPGNEELINRTIDNLFRLGADVRYSELEAVHVSGHGSREDHKLMINLVRPKYFIPIHGEYRHLVLHSRTAEAMGIPRERIFVIESGQVVEFTADGARLGEQVTEGHVLVDGLGVGDVGHVVLRDRRHLANDGFVVAIVGVDAQTGDVLAGPEILSRGFVYPGSGNGLFQAARERISETLRREAPSSALANMIKEELSEFFYKETRRRPMILPVVLEL